MKITSCDHENVSINFARGETDRDKTLKENVHPIIFAITKDNENEKQNI